MRTCARWWGRGSPLPLRLGITLLLIPPVLLALQLLVVAGPRLPRAAGVGLEEQQGQGEGAVAFSVISIEPGRKSLREGARVPRRPGLEEGEEEEEAEMKVADEGRRMEGTRDFEDENEMHWRQVRSEITDTV